MRKNAKLLHMPNSSAPVVTIEPEAPGESPAVESPPSLRSRISPSAILRIWARCQEVGGIDLATGIPSMPAAPDAVTGAVDALHAGENTYAQAGGIPELRQEIAGYLQRESALAYAAEDEILVSSGATAAIAASLMALFEPGDEILLPEPYFGWHANLIRLAGLVPRFVPLEGPRFEMNEAALRRATSEKTRGLILCTPANPTGQRLSRRELSVIRSVAQARNLTILTDEQYRDFRYDGSRHDSPASHEGLRERTITVGGFSKSLSVTGWRVGYAAGPKTLLSRIQKIHQLLYICPPTPLQHGVAKALRSYGGISWTLRHALQEKRDALIAALKQVGFSVEVPSAGFFVLAEAKPSGALSGWGSRDELALNLLDHVGIAAVPGHDFFSGSSGDRMLRFCFAKSDTEIRAACYALRALRRRCHMGLL